MPLSEADTCRRYVVPKLLAAGWETEPHRINEQVTFTDGRIIVACRGGRHRPGYILRYRPDVTIAVVEAKPSYATPGQGLQQAKEYAEILGLKFAYASNGHGIIEFDYVTGREREIFPTPEELWKRLTVAESLGPDERVQHHHLGAQPRLARKMAVQSNRISRCGKPSTVACIWPWDSTPFSPWNQRFRADGTWFILAPIARSTWAASQPASLTVGGCSCPGWFFGRAQFINMDSK